MAFDYRRRVLDDELDHLFPATPALLVEGPKAVGKTETASGRAATIFRLDDPSRRAVVAADPDIIVRSPRPVLIDEWQFLPHTWDIVRRAVYEDRAGGSFLLTGSASPREKSTHTGAGRIVSLRMRPMTLAERGVAVPTVSLSTLLSGSTPSLEGETDVTAETYANEILAPGLPGLRGLPERVVRAQLDGYLARIVDRDFRDLGGLNVRNQAGLTRWMRAYAAAISSTTSYEKIRDAATAGQRDKPAKPTVITWFDTLERLWMVEPVLAWSPAHSDLARLVRSPKHQFADPALAARLRGATVGTLLEGAPAGPLSNREATLFGALFEAQVTQDVRVYAQAAEARVFHFRTDRGDREVDLIVERADRRIVAIEVKLARTITDRDVRHLVWLREQLGEDLLDAVVISTGPTAYRRPDGIGVVPAALLGI